MDGIVKKLLLDVEAASQRPGAAESWAPVLTGVQGLLAAGLQGNRMVPPSVWDVVCAMGRAFPLLLQSGVEEAAATEGPEVPEQRWARSALSSGQLSTFLLKLPSQPQIFTAYSSSAPLRAPGAAARVAQALSQLHGLVAPPPRAEGSRDSAESPTTAADGCTVQAAASEASPTAASSSRASGSGASGRSPAPSCDGGSSVSVTAGADAAGGTSGGGVASAAAHYIETDEEALRRKSEREASAAARIQQVRDSVDNIKASARKAATGFAAMVASKVVTTRAGRAAAAGSGGSGGGESSIGVSSAAGGGSTPRGTDSPRRPASGVPAPTDAPALAPSPISSASSLMPLDHDGRVGSHTDGSAPDPDAATLTGQPPPSACDAGVVAESTAAAAVNTASGRTSVLDGLAAAFGYRRPSSSAATSRRLRFGAGVAAAAANEQEAAAAEALLRTAKAQKLSAEDAAEARQAAELAQKLQLAVVQLAAVARSQPAGVPLDASRCSELSSVLSLLQEVLQHGLLPPPATAIASVRDDGDRAFRALLLAEQLMMATAGGGGSGGGVTGGGAGGASATSSPRRVQLGLVGIQVAASRGADGSGKLHAWLLSTLSQHLLAPRLALLYQSRGVLSRWYGPGALLQQEEPLKQLVAAAVQLGSVDVAAAVVAAAAAGASSREEEPAAGRPGACETRAAAAAVEQVRDRQQPTAAAALLPSVAPATAAAPAAAAAVPVFHWPTSADPVAAPATAVGRIAEGPASNAASPLDARTSAAGVSAAAAPPAAYSLSPLSPSDLEVAASQYS